MTSPHKSAPYAQASHEKLLSGMKASNLKPELSLRPSNFKPVSCISSKVGHISCWMVKLKRKLKLTAFNKRALKSSPLGTLPPELVRLIAAFLLPASAATFSVCCREVFYMLGSI